MGGAFAIFLGAIVLPFSLIGAAGLALGVDALVAVAAWPFKIAMYVVAFNCFVTFPVYMLAVFIGKADVRSGDDGSLQRGADFGDDGGE